MQQRDIIKDQIDQLGRVLGKVIAELLGLKADGNVAQGIEVASQYIKQASDIDVAQIEEMTDEEFSDFLKMHPFNSNSLEIFADFLVEIGDFRKQEELPDQANRLFKHAFKSYEEANNRSDEYSMPRAAKQKNVKEQIKDF